MCALLTLNMAVSNGCYLSMTFYDAIAQTLMFTAVRLTVTMCPTCGFPNGTLQRRTGTLLLMVNCTIDITA